MRGSPGAASDGGTRRPSRSRRTAPPSNWRGNKPKPGSRERRSSPGGPISLCRATAPRFAKWVIKRYSQRRRKHWGRPRLTRMNCRFLNKSSEAHTQLLAFRSGATEPNLNPPTPRPHWSRRREPAYLFIGSRRLLPLPAKYQTNPRLACAKFPKFGNTAGSCAAVKPNQLASVAPN